jgi:hypothetical protein
MPLDLPRVLIRTESFDPVVAESCPELTPAELATLVALDRSTLGSGPVDRCIPLGPRRWAVGHRQDDDTVWRVVAGAEADRLGAHPAWLWTSETWFDPAHGRDNRARTPAALPLRHLVRLTAPVGGRHRRTIKALAAVVAGVRSGSPLALVVEPELLSSSSHPARWLVLALLAILPPARRDALRVSIGDTNPSPTAYDLVITSAAPSGFTTISAAEPPDEGDDLVAYYVRNRLYDDDPEALEAAAYLFDGDGDRWGDGIAALIREGLPGVSEVTPEVIEKDPERAVRAITARFRAGAPMESTLIDQLIRVTLATKDPRPWRALARRAALQRSDTVDALLAQGRELRPSAELITELCALYPRSAPLDAWVVRLLQWLEDGVETEAVVASLQTTLLEWPRGVVEQVRGSIWRDAVIALGRSGRFVQARLALAAPVAREIARDGQGRSLVEAWCALPSPARDVEHLSSLVELLHGSPGGDEATAELFQSVKDRREEAKAIIDRWVQLTNGVPAPGDPVFRAVHDTPMLQVWAEAVVEHTTSPAAPERAASPQLREHIADARVQKLVTAEVVIEDEGPRKAVLALGQLVTESTSSTGSTGDKASSAALQLAAEAVESAVFPDAELAGAAEALAGMRGASPIWSLLAVTAAAPDVWDDATIDATVVQFCDQPLDEELLDVALCAMRRLGAGTGWEPLDHARWIVRLALAPSGDDNAPLVGALLQGIQSRNDALEFMAGVLRELFLLAPDHPAIHLAISVMSEAGWQGPRLKSVIETVQTINIPLSVRRTLMAMASAPEPQPARPNS